MYKTSETDGEIVVSACKDKPIPSESAVIVMVASVTVENATTRESLSIPDSDPYSPNRASEIQKLILLLVINPRRKA